MAVMPRLMTRHYVLLVQCSNDPSTRTFSDFESRDQLVESLTEMYVDYLKEAYPGKTIVEYDFPSILKFVQGLWDISCLEYQQEYNMYAPHSKKWIAEVLYKHFATKQEF